MNAFFLLMNNEYCCSVVVVGLVWLSYVAGLNEVFSFNAHKLIFKNEVKTV